MLNFFADTGSYRRGLGYALPVILLSFLLIFKFPKYAMRIYWVVMPVILIALIISGVMFLVTHDSLYGKIWLILMMNLFAVLIFMREIEKGNIRIKK